jgi:cytochrome c oxidase assembly protein subunit 15
MTENDLAPDKATPSRWPHRWAVVTVCATVGLLLIGARVTTLRVGMADTEWPTHPLHLFFSSRNDSGYLIEHSHRLGGYVVGCCVIVLTVLLWLCEPRRWVRWLGLAALVGVILQGILGGFRVRLHDLFGTDLATIHGCFAQLVFALLVSLALFTSRWWQMETAPAREQDRPRLLRLALLLNVVIFVQIIFGAVVRHSFLRVAQRFHFLLAFAVVALAVWLIRSARDVASDRRLSVTANLLAVLLAVQIVLGVESWLMRFGSGVLPDLQRVTLASGLVRTFHFVVGSLVFATSVVLTLLAARRPVAAVAYPTVRTPALEGAA